MRFFLVAQLAAVALLILAVREPDAHAQSCECVRLPAPVRQMRGGFSSVAEIIGRDSNPLPERGSVTQASAELPTDEEIATGLTGAPISVTSCANGACADCGGYELPSLCDDCPHYVLNTFVSFDSFRGVVDGGWQNNGLVAGFNIGSRLGVLSDLTGIGFQIGASIGSFDWSGSNDRLFHQDAAQTQGFFTFGLFRRALAGSPWTAAIVQDTMYNSNFGFLGQNPMMIQMRGQVGFCTSAWNEFGIWGTMRGFGQTLVVPQIGPVKWEPVQQLNVYWHHKWVINGPDTWFWVGRPEQSRLTRDGSLGDYLLGASANAPLTNRIALFALATYMHPSASAGSSGSLEEAWNFTIGLAFYPKPNARSTTVAGRCWAPLLPVANNGYFLTDSSLPFFGPI